MEREEWVNYRNGLMDYLIYDRSMTDLCKVRITDEIYMVSKIINGTISKAEKKIDSKTN